MKKIIRYISISLLPALLFFTIAEVIVRSLSLDKPSIVAGGSGIGPNSFVQSDLALGWALKPNSSFTTQKYSITINSLGLRSPEVQPKKKNEFRILSLGESSTFGVMVGDSETYSAQLQRLLNKTIQSRSIVVINAGISAYSSFQSLKYLELRGLKLKPDLILFYHEVNDYLPTAIHDTKLNEIGILKTDKQLYDSKLQRISHFFEKNWGFYRFLTYSYAKFTIKKLNRNDFENPIVDIGLPDLRVNVCFHEIAAKKDGSSPKLDPFLLGRRVSDEERLEILTRLTSICRDNNIRLIIIHPSYRYSRPHECVLTHFCKENNVLMFEAYHSLHPQKVKLDTMFIDLWHPTAYGHTCLAYDLSRFICKKLFGIQSFTKDRRKLSVGLTDKNLLFE
ncbi:MAG: SGNH/GDSL hydrolase family protein [bacterium]